MPAANQIDVAPKKMAQERPSEVPSEIEYLANAITNLEQAAAALTAKIAPALNGTEQSLHVDVAEVEEPRQTDIGRSLAADRQRVAAVADMLNRYHAACEL